VRPPKKHGYALPLTADRGSGSENSHTAHSSCLAAVAVAVTSTPVPSPRQSRAAMYFFLRVEGGGGLWLIRTTCTYTQQGRAHSRRRLHPAPRWGRNRAPGSSNGFNGPSGPLRRAQGRGPHRSRRPSTPLPGLRCGTRLAHRASPPRRPTPVVRVVKAVDDLCVVRRPQGLLAVCPVRSRSAVSSPTSAPLFLWEISSAHCRRVARCG
jgi:hypothetical protein